MRPNRCMACQGRDLYHTTMDAESKSSVFVRIGLSGNVAARCSVCLSCGYVATYLESGELDQVRTWKKRTRKTKVKRVAVAQMHGDFRHLSPCRRTESNEPRTANPVDATSMKLPPIPFRVTTYRHGGKSGPIGPTGLP